MMMCIYIHQVEYLWCERLPFLVPVWARDQIHPGNATEYREQAPQAVRGLVRFTRSSTCGASGCRSWCLLTDRNSSSQSEASTTGTRPGVRAPGRGWPVVPFPERGCGSWVHLGECPCLGTRPETFDFASFNPAQFLRGDQLPHPHSRQLGLRTRRLHGRS